ncbi:MAG: septum formation protein Maf [Bacteroidales bacterium]|nr:septum formation protein Maf [Bacteroidales bacterium]
MILNELIKSKRIILASASPRRKELMEGLDLNFTIDTRNNFQEVVPDGLDVNLVPEYLAKGKSYGFHRELEDDEIIITADTMVMCDGKILGKPSDKENAMQMLKMLQSNTHTVITGVCIRSREKEDSFSVTTKVFFNELSDEELDYYIENYRPYDKAGAYGVQEWIGHIGISRIEGSYFNVMGLPVQRLYTELQKFMESR